MPDIGQWVARFKVRKDGSIGERLTAWHLVESIIAGRAVTKCGRQLGDRPGTEVQAQADVPDANTLVDACERCK
jgi:hypothetical protein